MLVLKLLSGLLTAVCRILTRSLSANKPDPAAKKPEPRQSEPMKRVVDWPSQSRSPLRRPSQNRSPRRCPRPSHGFAVGDRVQRRGKNGCIGTVKGCPTPMLRGWPERVTVRWDKHGAEFDRNCNSNPRRDHVSPQSILRVAA